MHNFCKNISLIVSRIFCHEVKNIKKGKDRNVSTITF